MADDTTYGYIISTGTISVDTSDLKSTVEGEWKTALGQDLDTDSSTLQGTLIAGEVLARTKTVKNNAQLANMINPNLSEGVFLDAICSFLGMGRGSDSSTVATNVQITGDPGTLVTAGSQVRTSSNDIFYVVADSEIQPDRTGTVSLMSQAYGPIPLPVQSLTIVDGIIGWGSCVVTVGTTVTPGANSLTDPKLKVKRRQMLAYMGRGSSAAIRANVRGVEGIYDANVVENNTGATGLVNGVTFTLPNAIWVCVAGLTPGNKADVAAAAYLAHQGGCPWDFGAAGMGNPVDAPNGTQTNDPSTLQPYFVKLTTAVLHDVYVKIYVRSVANESAITASIQKAMADYANGLEDGEDGLLIGTSVSSHEMSGAAIRGNPGIYVKSCLVAVVAQGAPAPPDSAYTNEVVMNPYDLAQLARGNILVYLV